MKCPHPIEPHQIQGLDFIHMYPVVQVDWTIYKLPQKTLAGLGKKPGFLSLFKTLDIRYCSVVGEKGSGNSW